MDELEFFFHFQTLILLFDPFQYPVLSINYNNKGISDVIKKVTNNNIIFKFVHSMHFMGCWSSRKYKNSRHIDTLQIYTAD